MNYAAVVAGLMARETPLPFPSSKSRRLGWTAVILSAVARPRMPPPMIVRSYRDAIRIYCKFKHQFTLGRLAAEARAFKLNVEQLAGILFHESLDVVGIGLRRDAR